MSPLSTHVHQPMPYTFVRHPVNARMIHIEVEYFKKDVVRERADSYPSVELVCAAQVINHGKRGWRITTHLDLVRLLTPVVDGQCPFLHLSPRQSASGKWWEMNGW